MTTTLTTTTTLTRAQARQAVQDIKKAHGQTVESVLAAHESGQRCQRLVAMFYDCDGAAALGIDRPDAYLASMLEVSRQHVHRLKQAGRVLRLLSPKDGVGDTPSERQVRSLAKLLDQPEDLRSAYDAALADAGDTPLTGRHIATAVEKYLPPAPALPPDTLPNPNTNSHPDPTNGLLHDLFMAAATWVDKLNVDPSTPQQLMHAVEHVKTLAWNLHMEQVHELEPDQLLHTT